jgi:hypothetical protein
MRMWRYIIDKLCMVDESDIDRSVYTVVEMIHWTINSMKPCLLVLPPAVLYVTGVQGKNVTE